MKRDWTQFDVQLIHSAPNWTQDYLQAGGIADQLPPLAFAFLPKRKQEWVLEKAGLHSAALRSVRGEL